MNLALQLLISSFSAMLSLAAATDRSFFTSVELRDSLSGYNYSLDPNHWFLIEAEMFVSEGQTEDITLQIPNEFTALPNSPFSLLHHSKEIGKVVNNENVMTVSFPEPPSQNASATFNFLTKLDEGALEGLTGPQDVEYDFRTSQGDLFKQVMHYKAKSLDKVVANGGIYSSNKTAWFTVDIPVSQLDRPVYITSQPKMGASKYMIDTTKTRCEMVSEVGAFNEPLESMPFTPLEDRSSSSGINMKFDKTNGMDVKYVRITYFTLPLQYSRVGSQVSFRKRSASGILKRDFKNNLDLEIFGDPHVNLFPRDDATQNSAHFKTYSNNTMPVSRSYNIPSSVLSSSASPSSILASISSMSSIPSVTFADSANAATPSPAAPSNGTSSQKPTSSSGTPTSSVTAVANATSSETPSISSSASSTPVNTTSAATSKSSTVNAGVSTAPNSTSPAPTSGVSSSITSSVSNSTLPSELTSSSAVPSQTSNSTVGSTQSSTKQSSTLAQNTTAGLTATTSSVPSSSVLPTNNSTSSVTSASSSIPSSSVLPTNSSTSSVTPASSSGSSVSNFTAPSTISTSHSGSSGSSLLNSTVPRTSSTPSSSMLLNSTFPSQANVTPTSSSSSLSNLTAAPSSLSGSSSNSSNGVKYTAVPSSSGAHPSNSTSSLSPTGVSARVSPVTSYASNVSSTKLPSQTFAIINSTGSGKISSFTSLFPISTEGTSKNASVTGSSSPLETYSVITSSNNGEITSSTSWFPVATESPSKNSSIFSSPSPYETYSVITRTSNGKLTSFTSWSPIATENTKTNKSVPSIITGSTAEVYSSYAPVTTTQNGVVRTYESWYPVATRSKGLSNDTSDPKAGGYQTYTVITGTENGQATSFTSWFPVSTMGPNRNGTRDIVISSPTAELYSSCITTTQGGKVTSYNTWIPLSTNGPKPAISDSPQVQGTYSALTTNENGQQTTKTSWFPANTLSSDYNVTTFSAGIFTSTSGTQPIVYSSAIPFTVNSASAGIVSGQGSAIHESPYTLTATVSHQPNVVGGNHSFGFSTEIPQTAMAPTTQFGQAEQTTIVSRVSPAVSSAADQGSSRSPQVFPSSSMSGSLPVPTFENILSSRTMSQVSSGTGIYSGNNVLPTATSHIDSATQPQSTTFRTHRIVTTTLNGAETGSNPQPTNVAPSATNYSISYGSEETSLASSATPSDGSSTPATQTLTISYDTTQAVSTATNNGETEPCSCFQMVETLTRVPGGAWSTVGVSQSPISTTTTSSSSVNTKKPSGTVAKRDTFATKTNNVSQTYNLQTFEAGATRPRVSLLSSILCILVLFV